MADKNKRAPIKAATKYKLNDEFDAACAVCRDTVSSKIEIHHIDGNPQNPALENLLLVCGGCHNEFTRGTKREADALFLKRMAVAGQLAPRKNAIPKGDVINSGINNGLMGQSVYVEKFITKTEGKGALQIRPGSIGSCIEDHNYLEYLIKKLAAFRTAGSSYGQKRTGVIHPGVVKNQLNNEFGALPKDLEARRYPVVREYLKEKIDGTALGRNNTAKGIRNYHTEAEHLVPKSKRKKST